MLKNFSTCAAFAGLLLCAIPGRAANSVGISSTVLTGKGAEQFQDRDRVVVIGDSITCGGLYPTLLQVFYATRYPTRDIRIYDCGIGGDTAAGVLRRLDWDILSQRPNKATIMLGSNDLGFRNYERGKGDEQSLRRRQEGMASFRAGMIKIADRLVAAGVGITFLTPPLSDQTAKLEARTYPGFDDALGSLAECVAQLADKHNSGFVDVFHPMREINLAQQRKDPRFTIVGPDRFHPGPVGHFVMAYSVLKSQGHPRHVARMAVDAARGVVAEEVNCRICSVAVSGGNVTFDCLEEALPFPVPKHSEGALALVPFQQELNSEILVVQHLPPGPYRVTIDALDIGTYSGESLAAGVNLADNPNTPQFTQANRVYEEVLKARAVEASRRAYARIRHYYLSRCAIDFDNVEEFRRECQKFLGTLPKNERFKIYQDMVASAMAYIGDRKKYEADLEMLHAGISRSSWPMTHSFKIERTDGTN